MMAHQKKKKKAAAQSSCQIKGERKEKGLDCADFKNTIPLLQPSRVNLKDKNK